MKSLACYLLLCIGVFIFLAALLGFDRELCASFLLLIVALVGLVSTIKPKETRSASEITFDVLRKYEAREFRGK